MTQVKKIGIWMDHSRADIIEYAAEFIATKTVVSKFTHEAKEHSLGKNENLMHNKEQHQQAEYYKELGEVIKNCSNVILFGPTSAKTELFNILKTDHRFATIKMEVKQADKMTENQQHAFVKNYFSHNS